MNWIHIGLMLALLGDGAAEGIARPGPNHEDATQYVRVAIVEPDDPSRVAIDLYTQLTWLRENDFDIAGIVVGSGYLELVTTLDQVGELREAGFTILEHRELGALNDADGRALSDYADPDEIFAFLAQTVLDHPTIAELSVIGFTVENRKIYALEISDQPGVIEDEPAVLFNAQHHSREVATPHVVMDVIDTLTDGYAAADPQITNWVNSYKTICVPSVNPDGAEYVFTVSANWRKNRSFNAGGSRGVDLNRNYPYHWGSGSLNCERGTGSSGSAGSETYRGPSVASEPETQTMMQLAQTWNFVMATSYHASGRFIDYPYACNDGNPDLSMPEHAVIDEMMQDVADAIFAVDGVTYSVFSPVAIGPVNGDDTSWYYAHVASYPFIIEIGTSFLPPIASLPGILSRNRGGWMEMMERLGGARIDLYVRDADTLAPLEATVTLADLVFDTDELERTTKMPFGRHTWLVQENGTYNVQVDLIGYYSQTIPVSVLAAPVATTVDLVLVGPPIPGDFDMNGVVNLVDFATFANCFGGTVSEPPPSCSTAEAELSDLSGDGVINLVDFSTFAFFFGT